MTTSAPTPELSATVHGIVRNITYLGDRFGV